MQNWQKENPLHKKSKVSLVRDTKVVWEGPEFTHNYAAYQVRVVASWGDNPKNGSNCFYIKTAVYVVASGQESERLCLDDAPAGSRKIPKDVLALEKWNGCHSAGPWYYIDNAVYLASEKDCNGLLKGESRQIINGRTKQPSWIMVAKDAEGNEMPIHQLPKYADGDKPDCAFTLEWAPWCRIGEGKVRELESARKAAIWLDATDEDLAADGLEDRLKARHPALVQEFHDVIVGLGFTW